MVVALFSVVISSSAQQSMSSPASVTQTKQYTGIHFVADTWSQLLTKARAEHKLIFIDFYTQWCGPCYNMATTVFKMPQIGDFYNTHFVNAKIDAEEGEGSALAKKYKVRSYPTYLFVNPVTEEVVHYSSSRQSAEQFLQTGKSALHPEFRSTYLNEEYEKGSRDKNFLLNYIQYKHSIFDRDQVQRAFDELIKGGATLKNQEIWNTFVEAVPSLSPYLFEVSNHYAEYCQLYGKTAVDTKLRKETQYGDIDKIASLCDFEGKTFNLEMIRISNALFRQHNYDEAIRRIDALMADSDVDKQQLIDRLKYMVRLREDSRMPIPQKWFDKCIEYLRFIAYNNADRDDAVVHQSYAAALELAIKRMNEGKPMPDCLGKAPRYGQQEYNMRPQGLKLKPQYKGVVKK